MRTYELIVCIAFVLILIPLLTHYYLLKVSVDDGNVIEISPWAVKLAELDRNKGIDLKSRIEELLRIKLSVSTELRDLESKKQKLQNDLGLLNKRLEESKNEASRRRNELERLQISLQQAKVAEKEAMERNTAFRLGRPKSLTPLRSIKINPFNQEEFLSENVHCQMDSCFDYSFCPISSSFSFYLYPFISYSSMQNNSANSKIREQLQTLHQELEKNPNHIDNPKRACLFFLIIENCEDEEKIFKSLKALPNWFGDGRNHVIWLNCNTKDGHLNHAKGKLNLMGSLGRAMILSQTADKITFRPEFDLIVSHWEKTSIRGEIWSQLPPIVPAKRKYLATYLGAETDEMIQSELLKIQHEDPLSFVFQFSCIANSVKKGKSPQQEGDEGSKGKESYESSKRLSNLCENDLLRTRLLLDSTFSLILLRPEDLDTLSSSILQLRLFESLKYGAIPVILGTRFIPPFEEVIDWSRVIIKLPTSRITELHYYLKALTDSDLLAYRKNGRLIFERYFGTLENVVNTLLGTIRTRIGVPPSPYKDLPSPSVFNETFTPLKLSSFTLDPEEEENLGPIEPSYPSSSFARNFTITTLQKYELWNVYYQPFKLFPFTPWDILMPSEAKFKGSSIGFRPISFGAGGSGKEFSESIGGNLPKEQFTVVILTYEREQVLLNSLQRLFSLPYLNKVVVVWNSPIDPSPELKWPDINVPVHIIKAKKNSLNNRFFPYDVIETEAILSIDDDAHLRHDEIVFGFRVWRENRDRIVGFPGRYHASYGPDKNFGGWHYNSNYSCELSMVLTGAAFYHKIYSYLYAYEMPEAIRNKVDELMNCEDIAMNFLVSHVTQKPPVKVTSRWTFRCPGCPVTLSEDDSHFQERHHCINYFSQVYGYTPLQYTQFRADSILFKTRIPHDKQKCFKYI